VRNLPPGLEEFGDRLREAAETMAGESRADRRRRRVRSLALPVAATMATAAVGAGAVSYVDGGRGPRIEGEAGSRGATLRAPKDSAVVPASATDDPDGGPPWVLRVFTNEQGRDCVQAGRLRDGDFGQLQRGRFRELPASAPSSCAAVGEPFPIVFTDRRAAPARLLVFGLAERGASLTIRVGARRVRVKPLGLGAFVAVFRGAERRERVEVRSFVGGRIAVRRLH